MHSGLTRSRTARRTRTGVAAVALAALVVLAGCSAVLGADGQPVAGDAGPQTISVSASGQVTGDPDEANVHLAVTADGKSAEAVREQLAQDAASLRAALADVGVTEDQIQTTSFTIRERGPYEDREERPPFHGRHSFLVTLDDLDMVGTVIDAATAGGASTVSGVWFTLSEERQQELREQALTEAMETARSEADVLAAAGGLSVTNVHAVSTGSGPVYPVRFDQEAAMGGADGTPTTIDSGPITVSASVSVVYNATVTN